MTLGRVPICDSTTLSANRCGYTAHELLKMMNTMLHSSLLGNLVARGNEAIPSKLTAMRKAEAATHRNQPSNGASVAGQWVVFLRLRYGGTQVKGKGRRCRKRPVLAATT